MKQTAIIYCRKSTDRDELQQNSLEHQLNNCRNTVKINKFVVSDEDEIVESVSAKTEFKRDWFNRMIDKCKKWEIDYIVIDEPKRLSRNNIDSSRIIDLLDKKKIKWIIATSRQYLTENSRDKFLLHLDLSLSKMDNEDRSKDVKDKMMTAVKSWKWMWQSIFWYRNVWTRWKKDIEVVEEEAKIVIDCFIMRKKWLSFWKIANYVNEKMGTKWNEERASRMLSNTKYYWLQKYCWLEEYITSPWYVPIVNKELFDEINWIKSWRSFENAEFPKYFYNILKDTEWRILYAYEKVKKSWKKYIYYHKSWNLIKERINVSEKYLFDEIWKQIKYYNFPREIVSLVKEYLKDYYKVKNDDIEKRKEKEEKEISKLEIRKKNLFNLYLDWDIPKSEYEESKKEIESDISNKKEKINWLNQWNENVEKNILDYCELIENLSETYIKWNKETKWRIIRAMNCELVINKKKELVIKENKLFNLIKNINLLNWCPERESNSHSSLNGILSPTCLPIPPSGQI